MKAFAVDTLYIQENLLKAISCRIIYFISVSEKVVEELDKSICLKVLFAFSEIKRGNYVGCYINCWINYLLHILLLALKCINFLIKKYIYIHMSLISCGFLSKWKIIEDMTWICQKLKRQRPCIHVIINDRIMFLSEDSFCSLSLSLSFQRITLSSELMLSL